MLSDEDKNRIRLEEIYREEVRREIAAGSGTAFSLKRLVSFLNTGLGLWMLSTLLVGGATFLYTELQERHREAAEKRALVTKLDIEIRQRFQNYDILLLHGNISNLTPGGLLAGLLDAPGRHVAVYPDFENRGLNSLLTELEALLPEDARAPVSKAKEKLAELQAKANSRRDTCAFANEVLGVLKSDVLIDRWRRR